MRFVGPRHLHPLEGLEASKGEVDQEIVGPRIAKEQEIRKGDRLEEGSSVKREKEIGMQFNKGRKKVALEFATPSNTALCAIGSFNHPVITSKSRSTATESVSSPELVLPVTNGRQLHVVSREDDWVEAVKGRYGFDTVLLPAEHESGGPHWDIRCLLTSPYAEVNRTPEQYDETQETDTHKFHGKIYKAARFLAAAYVNGRGLCDGDPFPPAARTAIATLQHSLKVIAARRWEDPS
ncbi:hypothetical protein B0H14DRAFT_3492241 [Mycena olivaceomarginata]|nr:hypothetical protein B0H14DRAFT_3492241 [Mycena olivaceomarginata]